MLLTFILFADDMAPKSALAEFRCQILQRPLEGDGSNSLGSIGSRDLKFTLAPDSFAFEVHPSKKQKGKKVAKEKKVI